MSLTIDDYATPTRTTCMKCGCKIDGDTAGINCWCYLCRWLVRRPDVPYPRYRPTPPPEEHELSMLGLTPSFDERQAVEPVPNGRYVESWYDPEEPEYDPAAKFDRIFNRALGSAA